MPVCPVCESEEFDLLHGLYFCRLCSTQSQEIVEEDYEDVVEVISGKILDKNKGNLRKSSRTFHKADRGKPWYSVEGFQVILKAQVNALVRLGCAPRLEKIVKQIWFKYIQESGIVVINPDLSKNTLHNHTSLRFRDEYLSGVLGKKLAKKEQFPTLKNTVKLRFPAQIKGGKKRKLSTSSEDDATQHEKEVDVRSWASTPLQSDEEWFSLASSCDSSDSEEETDSRSKSSKIYRRPERYNSDGNPHWSVAMGRRQIHHLNLPKLVAILFVGLQWLKELITIGDLIMWIRQGYVPYIDCVSTFLPHMKLTDFDLTAFHPKHVPSYAQILELSKQLIKHVQMPEMPDVNVQKLVAKYIVLLNLPHALIALVQHLFNERVSFTRKNLSPLNDYTPDLLAAGEIIIALKFLFGLDDEREWNSDETPTPCSGSTREESATQCKPFLWKEWYAYHLRRRRTAKQNPSDVFTSREVREFKDIHSYTEHWRNVILHPLLSGKEVEGGAKGTKGRREKMETKRWAFEKLCATQGSLDEMEHRKAKRKIPYVFPYPSEDENMSKRCIQHVTGRLNTDIHYVRYADTFSRAEFCFNKEQSKSHYSFRTHTLLQPSVEFHQSYDFVLLLFQEITCAPKLAIHDVVRDVEAEALSQYLVPITKDPRAEGCQ